MMKVLPQKYAGIRFRSSLETRWAMFFDHAGVGWEYEPEGFAVGGRAYRPDFLLDCGTWVEVKGDPERLDLDLMLAAAKELPGRHDKQAPDWAPDLEVAPKLLILGSIPEVTAASGGPGWLGLEHYPDWHAPRVGYYGFGAYRETRRMTDLGMIWPAAFERLSLAWLDGDEEVPELEDKSLFENLRNYGHAKFFLTPKFFPGEPALSAYAIARAHRFGRPA